MTRILISELKREAENYGSNLTIVSIPFREQVYENLWKLQLSKPGMAKREWDLNKPDQILSRFLTNAGIPFLQLLPHFKKAAEDSELYHAVGKDGKDGHWNIAGHHLAGQVILDWIVEKKLVPVEAEG